MSVVMLFKPGPYVSVCTTTATLMKHHALHSATFEPDWIIYTGVITTSCFMAAVNFTAAETVMSRQFNNAVRLQSCCQFMKLSATEQNVHVLCKFRNIQSNFTINASVTHQ